MEPLEVLAEAVCQRSINPAPIPLTARCPGFKGQLLLSQPIKHTKFAQAAVRRPGPADEMSVVLCAVELEMPEKAGEVGVGLTGNVLKLTFRATPTSNGERRPCAGPPPGAAKSTYRPRPLCRSRRSSLFPKSSLALFSKGSTQGLCHSQAGPIENESIAGP